MKKKAFTLVELLISIVLFGIITIFLFGAIDEVRQEQKILATKENMLMRKNRLIFLLRNDLTRPGSVTLYTTQSKDFDTLKITGSSFSLYGIDRPYVYWLVLKEKNALVRLESANAFSLPILPAMLYQVHADIIDVDCEDLKVYGNTKGYFAHIRFANQHPVYFEVLK